jgi:glycosyltransferase involved in cell wall biosynthesis
MTEVRMSQQVATNHGERLGPEAQAGIARVGMLVKKSLTAIMDQGILSGSNFAISVVLARWMPVSDYAAYAVALSVFYLLSGIHNALLLEPMTVFGGARYRIRLRSYEGTLLCLHAGLSLLLSLSLVISAWLLPAQVHATRLALCGLSLFTPTVLLHWLARRAAYLEMRPNLAAAASVVYGSISLGGAFVLCRAGLLSPFTAPLPQCVAALASSVLLLVVLKPKLLSREFDLRVPAVILEHWSYGKWVIATAVGYWLSTGAYYMVVALVLPAVKTAELRALLNLATPLNQAIAALGLLILPIASAAYADGKRVEFKAITRMTTLAFTSFGIAYLIFLIFAGTPLMRLLYHGRYSEVAALLPLSAVPTVLLCAAEGFIISLRARMLPSTVFWGFTLAGVCSIPFGVLFTLIWGLTGALSGLSLASLIFLGYIVLSERRWRGHASNSPGDNEIRLAVVTPTLNRSYYVQPVFSELAKLIPQLTIYTGKFPGYISSCENGFSVCELQGTREIMLKRRSNGYDLWFQWQPISLLFKLVSSRPNVVAMGHFGMWSLYLVLYKLVSGCSLVFLLDGTSPGVSFVDQPLRLLSRRMFAPFIDAALSNTKEGSIYLRDVVGIPEDKVRHGTYLVPHLKSLSAWSAQSRLIPCQRPEFLYVGSLSPRKGIGQLLDAAAALVESGFAKFSLLLVGGGPREELMRQVRERNLEGLVQIIGEVPYQQLGAFYSRSDVLILPSLDDVYGMVVPEAMAFGKPVLCSKYANAKELVVDGVNGYAFDPLDCQRFSSLIREMAENPEKVREMGLAAREMISDQTPETAAREMVNIVFTAFETQLGNPISTTENRLNRKLEFRKAPSSSIQC